MLYCEHGLKQFPKFSCRQCAPLLTEHWTGVDLDGTLAYYDSWRGVDHVGDAIPVMVARVEQWLKEKKQVRIFTARAFGGPDVPSPVVAVHAIQKWCLKEIGKSLAVTCFKDYFMEEFWDDRAIQVVPNTGMTLADEIEALRSAHRGKVAKPGA